MEKQEQKTNPKLSKIKFTDELIEELLNLQRNDNFGIHSEIERITEVIETITIVHSLDGDEINPDYLFKAITELSFLIQHFRKLKAPYKLPEN